MLSEEDEDSAENLGCTGLCLCRSDNSAALRLCSHHAAREKEDTVKPVAKRTGLPINVQRTDDM
jgi:hypothetical protein